MNERIAKYDPSDEAISTYQEVGVVYLPDILDAEWIKHLAASIDEVVERDDLIVRNFSKIAETLVDPEKPAEPGSLQERLADKIGKATGRFLMGCGNWSKTQDLRALITHTCLGRIAGALMQSSEVRVHNDLMFCKEPGSLHRTAWHQDMSYWNIQGDQCLTLWIPVDVVDEGNGMMGYIRGSHRWQDEFKSNRIVSEITHEAAAGKTLTVEGHEDEFDIVYIPAKPGDIIAHHVRTIHGATGNTVSRTRRAAAFSYVGDDIRYFRRSFTPESFEGTNGDLLREPRHPVVWSAAG